METPEPWVYGPLELIKHAEEHQLANGDFDKRMALIGYDNAIEVSIRTFLQLHSTQRRGAEYPKVQVNTWLTNYHSLLDFFFDEFLTNLVQTPQIAKKIYIHYHDLRNNLYHEGKNFVPVERDIQGTRAAALYTFSVLFAVNGEELLQETPTLHTPNTTKINFHGSEIDIFKIPLKEGVTLFRIRYTGRSSHTCDLYDENDSRISQLITPLEGHFALSQTTTSHRYGKQANIEKDGVYVLKVLADSGIWDIEVE